jgi:hypothetical protein
MGEEGGWLLMVEYGHLADYLRTLCGLQGGRPAPWAVAQGMAGPPNLRGPHMSAPPPYPDAGCWRGCRNSGGAGRVARPVDNCSGPGAGLLG